MKIGDYKLKNLSKRAFTVTELFVVTALIGILSIVFIPYYKSTKDQFALLRSAYQLAQDIRRAQAMALASEKKQGSQEEIYGYGIYLKKSLKNYYILFRDKNDNKVYDEPSDDKIGDIDFEQGIEINTLEKEYINISFQPPDPVVSLKHSAGIGGGNDLGDDTEIEIHLINDPLKIKKIIVNKAGLIYVK